MVAPNRLRLSLLLQQVSGNVQEAAPSAGVQANPLAKRVRPAWHRCCPSNVHDGPDERVQSHPDTRRVCDVCR